MIDWRYYLVEKFYSKIENGWRILDVGTGFLSNLELLIDSAITKAFIVSIDVDEKALERAKNVFRKWVEKKRLELIKADVTNLPFQNNFFNLTTTTFTLHHIKDIPKAISELYRVTNVGGWIIIVDWEPNASLYTPHSPDELEATKEKILGVLKEVDLNAKIEEFDYWYLIYLQK